MHVLALGRLGPEVEDQHVAQAQAAHERLAQGFGLDIARVGSPEIPSGAILEKLFC